MNDGPSLAQSLQRLFEDLGALFRAELNVFRRELTEQMKQAGEAGGYIAAGALMGIAVFGAFTAFLILVLAVVMPAWGSALLVTVIYGAIAAVLLAIGRNKWKAAMPLDMDRTTRSVKEDVEWVKSRMNTAK
jgi:hypothetical protein